jgi:hypothetical protein
MSDISGDTPATGTLIRFTVGRNTKGILTSSKPTTLGTMSDKDSSK